VGPWGASIPLKLVPVKPTNYTTGSVGNREIESEPISD
jgi:hypothetical protein